MMRISMFLTVVLLMFGCAQTVQTIMVDDRWQIEVHDDGVMSYLNSGSLNSDWDDQAGRVCPRGYDVVSRDYLKEEPFRPARIVGVVRCK